MDIVCLILLCIFLMFSWSVYKTLKHPAVVFNLLWSALILISLIGYTGIEKPDNQVYGIFALGGALFNIAAFFTHFAASKNNRSNKPSSQGLKGKRKYSFVVTKKQLNILTVVQMVLLVYYAVKTVGLLRDMLSGFSYDSIRSYYFSDQYLSSQLEYLALTYIIDPLLTLTQILFGINLFTKSISKPVSVIMLANILMRTFISGGRMLLLELVVIVSFCYLIIGTTRRFTRKQKFGMITLVIIATAAAVAITTGRGREGTFFEKIQEMLVVNFTGSFTYFDTLMESDSFVDTAFGTASFAGILDPFMSIFRFLGLTNALTKQVEIGNIIQEFVHIGSYSYNAMPTMYYFFMTDFGVIGILVMPVFLGVVSTKMYKRLRRDSSVRMLVMYLLCILVIVESPMTWLPFKSSFALAIIIAMFVFPKKKGAVK